MRSEEARRRLLIGLGVGLGLTVVALLFVRVGIGGRDPTWTRIQNTGVWRVGMDPSFPPFESLDAAGRSVGLDVDLAAAIATTWGVRVEIVSLGFDELPDAVHAHKVDSAISALPVNPLRTQDVAFSAPYVEAGLLLVAPAGSDLRSLDDLVGRRVAVEWGGNGDVQARMLARKWEDNLILVLRDSVTDALDALLAGDADAALVDAISFALYARRSELVVVGQPVVSDPYAIVVPHDAPDLLRRVNQTLAALAADGTLDQIKGRWLRPETK